MNIRAICTVLTFSLFGLHAFAGPIVGPHAEANENQASMSAKQKPAQIQPATRIQLGYDQRQFDDTLEQHIEQHIALTAQRAAGVANAPTLKLKTRATPIEADKLHDTDVPKQYVTHL